MLFSYCCGRQWNWRRQKWRRIARNFDCHGDKAVRGGVHRPIEHVQGFTGKEATGCHHWESACAVSPRWPPWSTNLLKQHKTLTKHNFELTKRYISSASCLWEFQTPKRTFYSAHLCDKLRLNVKCHDWSWRAHGHFLLSNVVSGQILEKLSN